MIAATPRKQFLIRSDDLSADEFGALFSRLFGNLYAHLPPLDRKVVIAGVYGRHEGVSFRRMSYQGDFTTRLPDMDDEITFVFPVAGRIVFELHDEQVGTPRYGLAVEKAGVRSVSFVGGHQQYGISVRRELFARRLALLLGKPVMEKVRFQPVVDLQANAFQGIRAIIAMATGNEFDALISSSALMPQRLQEMLVDAVLEAWPHTYSEALKAPAPTIAPRHVKLAVDYIREHPDLRINSSELAALSNVSLRALQDGFRRFVGTSIVSYQRQVRLERAHAALRADDGQSISALSLSLGFSNVGRFCQYFQSAYGVSPLALRKGAPAQN
ncbi:MAG: helix-turn-helix domain-containing protein [Pseudomonas sp.]|uniref:AraC family transcriptional regulator n=1 Tax=Pseudomonas sp. TaxID=306 RepID=UPI003D0A63B6